MSDLERLRELESAATPGPWETRGGESTLIFRRTPDWPVFDKASGYAVPPTTVAGETPADAAFIVAAIAHVRRELDAAASPEAGEGLIEQWLIERGPEYWTHMAGYSIEEPGWVADPYDAAKFPTREEAERWIADHSTGGRAVQHGFQR